MSDLLNRQSSAHRRTIKRGDGRLQSTSHSSQLNQFTFILQHSNTTIIHRYDAVKEACRGSPPSSSPPRGYHGQASRHDIDRYFLNLKHAWRVFKLVSDPSHLPGDTNTLLTDGVVWRRACSEIIPFKLDLDNSSERTSCFLDALPTAPPGVLTSSAFT